MLKKPTIGILGGIGSGKSTVARLFGTLGCAVIDADVLAHEVLAEPETVAVIVKRFGPEVMNNSGEINRRALAGQVFDSPEAIEFLNNLIHPGVLQKCHRLITQYSKDKTIAAIVLDMPLLMEVGWEKKCDFLVFVDSGEVQRLEWAMKNGKIDVKQLKKRENWQISLDKKKQIAHYNVYNNSDESDVAEQIAQIFSSITKSS